MLSLYFLSSQISELQSKVSSLESQRTSLQLELTSAQEELSAAREDAKRYAGQAATTQELYERELIEHGKTMEALLTAKEQVGIIFLVTYMYAYMYM